MAICFDEPEYEQLSKGTWKYLRNKQDVTMHIARHKFATSVTSVPKDGIYKENEIGLLGVLPRIAGILQANKIIKIIPIRRKNQCKILSLQLPCRLFFDTYRSDT